MRTTAQALLQPAVWPALALGLVLVLIGTLLQSPLTLAGDPLAHLILAATAAVLILHRVRDLDAQDHRGTWLAVILAAVAALFAFASPLAAGLRPVMINLALALLALSLVADLFGRRLVALLAVPVLVLFVVVPVLPLFEAALSYPLRRLSALIAGAFLSLGPGELVLNGTELRWGNLAVSVTSACSGLTLLQNLLWVAWWTVLLRHRGLGNRLLHGALVIPAVIIANSLRVIALAVMARTLGEQSLSGPGHVIIGWIAVVLAGVLFLAIEHLFPPTREVGQSDADS